MPTLGKKIIRSPNNGNPIVVAVAADAVPSFGSIATNTTQPPSDTQQTEQQTTEQQQPQTPAQNNTQSTTTNTPTTHKKKTNVDGKGMWRHWKRNFKNKLLALLDLIDNSLDAAVVLNNTGEQEDEENKDFIGRVHIYPDEVDNSNNSIQSTMNNLSSSSNNVTTSNNNSGLVIVNNSYRPIQSMEYCLGAYNSSKVDSGSSDIGENVSFVLLLLCGEMCVLCVVFYFLLSILYYTTHHCGNCFNAL